MRVRFKAQRLSAPAASRGSPSRAGVGERGAVHSSAEPGRIGQVYHERLFGKSQCRSSAVDGTNAGLVDNEQASEGGQFATVEGRKNDLSTPKLALQEDVAECN